MEKWRKIIGSTVAKYYKITEDREDATQEIIYNLLKSGEKYDLNEGLVRTFSRNHCINALKKRRLKYDSYAELHWESFGWYSCKNDGFIEIERKRILDQLNMLTKRQKRTVSMLIEGYGYHEIADKAGISYNAVKLSISAARKRLKLCN